MPFTSKDQRREWERDYLKRKRQEHPEYYLWKAAKKRSKDKNLDFDISPADSQLTVKSIHANDKPELAGTIHKGISKRQFTRTFTLADDVVVNGAELKDGMLVIDLEKIVPEEKKPKTIKIK